MAATTLGFIPLQLIQTNTIGQYNFDKGFPTNGTYVVVKTPTVAQQLQLTKSIKDMQNGREINNNEPASKPVILRCKRRVDFTGLGCKLVDSNNPSVSRRNERERKRVKMVNMGFETLRQHVPSGRKNKKMSKVETLRSAVQYIKQLQDMLDASDNGISDLDNVDMDELENKVSELIQSAANAANDNSNMEDSSSEIDSCSDNIFAQQQQSQLEQEQLNQQQHNQYNLHHQQQNHQQQQQHNHQQHQMSPVSSPECPESPPASASSQIPTQEHFKFHLGNFSTSQEFNTQFSYSSAQMAYSQASPSGSLHSPTASVVSDSSYDSVGDHTGHDDDDILSGFTNWF